MQILLTKGERIYVELIVEAMRDHVLDAPDDVAFALHDVPKLKNRLLLFPTKDPNVFLDMLYRVDVQWRENAYSNWENEGKGMSKEQRKATGAAFLPSVIRVLNSLSAKIKIYIGEEGIL